MSNSSKNRSIITAWSALLLAVALLALNPSVAAAQDYCAQNVENLLDTTNNCVSEPWRDRAFTSNTFSWKGHDYLIFNRGNELSIYNIDNPANPSHTRTSDYDFSTGGDTDYALVSFDVCDECRYAVFSHAVERTVVVDLGTGSTPTFAGHTSYEARDSVAGGYVFGKGGQHYLITGGFPDGCYNSGLYLLNGTNQVELLECLEVGGSAVDIKGLNTMTSGGVLYLYAGALNGQVHVFRFDDTGVPSFLAYEISPPGMRGRHQELSIDVNNELAASADFKNGVVRIFDLSTPDSPFVRYQIPAEAATVSLRSPSPGTPSTLFAAAIGWPNSTRTFAVDNFGYDPVVDELYWTDTTLPHNNTSGCSFETGGSLSLDGSALYLSRYAIQQVYDLTDCLTPTPPSAAMSITPPELFPGDAVTVRDISTGRADRWALWITEGSSPSGTVVAGNSTMLPTNDRTISYDIPAALADGEGYWAHLELESDDFDPPYDFDSLSLPISVDRRSEATISVNPDTVIVTEMVDLSVAVNGGSPTSYDWEIWAPEASTPQSASGQQVQNLALNVSGQWRFDVFVGFQHDNPDGAGLYEATDSYFLTVSSVAADFSISPSSPLHNQAITLNGTLSQPSGGNLGYAWQISGGAYNGCPAAAICTIPANTLSKNTTYTVTLTVTNNDVPADPPSQKSRLLTVNDGDVQPTIGVSPSSPERGQAVNFTIEGVPVDIDKATWTMGGSGCDGASATQVCVPSLFDKCKSLSFEYSTSGTKTVRLTVEALGLTYPETQTTVTVAATGSCEPTTPPPPPPPPPTCTYNLGPVRADFGPNGGETTYTVNTQSGCQWTASTSTLWITLLAPSGQVTGTGTVRIRVAENTGPERIGSVLSGGQGFAVVQEAPWVPANFTMSNPQPEIGEVVTFSVDPILEVKSWDFGEADCRGNEPVVDCLFLPGSACNTMQWSFASAGQKSVTMVLADGRTQTKPPTVVNLGECCLADGRPDADFTMSADEAYTGETITFTDLSEKSLTFSTKALSFGWIPQNPEIGEIVAFTLAGLAGDIAKATWDFGGTGCDDAPSVFVCDPGPWDECETTSFTYDSSGDKTVTVTVEMEGGGSEIVGPRIVTVANAGECDDGGGGGGNTCSYSVNPTSASLSHTGGSGSFAVTTTQDCDWSPITYSSWVHITSGGGFGSGTVQYTVDANTSTSSRSATIYVEGQAFRLTQSGDKGDTAPSEWRWTVTRVLNEVGETVDEDYYSSADQHMSYRFADPGRYRVSLTAINCYGTNSTHRFVEITESPVKEFVIGAAISQTGANNTTWETDLRFYNPCGELIDVRIEYLPENTDNAGAELVFREFQLQQNETRTFEHITEAIPGLSNPVSGSVRIGTTSDSGCQVLSVSRTFNDTPDGSLGLFVPALPVKHVGLEYLDVTGLIHNQSYRTNLRLVNYSDEEVWVPLTAYDKLGAQVGDRRSVKVKAQSTRQIDNIAVDWFGATDDLAPFSVRAEIDGLDVEALGTVVDNITGDSVLYLSSFHDENQIWLVGVASLAGANNSQWRTDLWLYNPTEKWLLGEIEFVVGDDPSESYGFAWPPLPQKRTRQYIDIVSDQLGLEGTRGYIVLTGDGPAPQVSARTYNLDPSGGTYGLNLRAFGSKDLLQPGEVGYIVGISNSDDISVGYRTNVGVLNTNRNGWTTVRTTMYDLDGNQAAEPYETQIAPGRLRQFDVFKLLDLGNITMTGSLKIEAISGGAVAVYATEIDNRNQDSIFIPAQRLFMGLAR